MSSSDEHPQNPGTSQRTLTRCDLCGLSFRAGRFEAEFCGTIYRFCCIGCRQVFTILMEATDSGDPAEFRESDLFRRCQEAGIIPKTEADLIENYSHGDAVEIPSITVVRGESAAGTSTTQNTVLDLTLKISNMWCPACAWLIDESLKRTPGVIDSTCNFSTDRLHIAFNPIQTSPDRIIEAIKKLGYRAAAPDESQEAAERRKEFVRFAISAFLTMNIMMLSYALYSGFFTRFIEDQDAVYKLSWPAFIMASMVLLYGGFELFKKAWSGFTNSAFSMETLIVIGALSAYLYSTVSLFSGSIHIYYDTAAMLITLVLLGKTLERRAKGKVLESLENFFALKPAKVRICTDDHPAGRYVSVDYLSQNDVFRIDENEIIPADGKVLTGHGLVDESSLTGEPLPIQRKPGDPLRSGTRVLRGTFMVSAQKVGVDSTLGQMIAIIEKTLMAKTPLEGRTDIILQWFVPIIIALAAGTAVACLLAGIPLEAAILRAVTVLVISCPCALGIAIPLARVAGISMAGKKGLLVRNFKAFEQAERATAFVFDKTGTITAGQWNLLEVICAESLTGDEALALAAGLEKDCDHFIAVAIRRQVHLKNVQPVTPTHIQVEEKGIQGNFNGRSIKIGSAGFLAKELEAAKTFKIEREVNPSSSHSFVYLGIEGRLAAIFVFGDSLRPDAAATISNLKARKLHLALISGDGQQTTRTVAAGIGIEQALGSQLPPDKARFVRDLQRQGHHVAMVGDGINDAPALVQADLAIAVHSGGQLSKETADVTLMRGEPSQIIDFLDFAGRVNKKIYQNLAFTYLYNAVSIPIAMSGLLNPLVAVTAMLLSSLSVTGNTLLLVRKSA
jgi:heavy metal translocating P-type ATPase